MFAVIQCHYHIEYTKYTLPQTIMETDNDRDNSPLHVWRVGRYVVMRGHTWVCFSSRSYHRSLWMCWHVGCVS